MIPGHPVKIRRPYIRLFLCLLYRFKPGGHERLLVHLIVSVGSLVRRIHPYPVEIPIASGMIGMAMGIDHRQWKICDGFHHFPDIRKAITRVD